MRHFLIKHKNIKFRKRKCGKERTAAEEEYAVADFENLLSCVLCFNVLPSPRGGEDGALARCPLCCWERFPSEHRQVQQESSASALYQWTAG
jgi:hypothetical protein